MNAASAVDRRPEASAAVYALWSERGDSVREFPIRGGFWLDCTHFRDRCRADETKEALTPSRPCVGSGVLKMRWKWFVISMKLVDDPAEAASA